MAATMLTYGNIMGTAGVFLVMTAGALADAVLNVVNQSVVVAAE